MPPIPLFLEGRRSALAVFAFGVLALSACRDLSAVKFPDGVGNPSGNASNGGGNGPASGGKPSPGPKPKPSPSPEIPTASLYRGSSDLAPFVEKFVADGLLQHVDLIDNMRNDPVTIQIGSLDSYGQNVIGLCETNAQGRTVTFDPDFWNTQNDRQREVLAHHELGHCVLFRDHRSGSLDSGDYLSVMNPIVMQPPMYDRNYDYYQKELYTWKGGSSPMAETVDVNGGDRTFICDPTEL